MNDYQNLRAKWLAKYRYARRRPEDYRVYERQIVQDVAPSTPNHVYENVSPVHQALHFLAQAGYTGLTVDDLAYLSPRDQQCDDELTVMADVRAYFTIACKV